MNYSVAKEALKNHSQFSEKMIRDVANYLAMSETEVIQQLEKPLGLKQLMMGKWPNERREKTKSEREARLEAALKLVVFVEQSVMTPEQITVLISTLLKEYGPNRAKRRG